MRYISETLKMLEAINNNIKREHNKDGVFIKASFELSDGVYYIDKGFDVMKEDNTGVAYIPISYCKGGIYPQIQICGMPIKMYVLSMIAQDEAAFNLYKSGLDINHTVISKIEPKVLNIGTGAAYERTSKVITTAPRKELSYNPAYLELVSRSSNVKHGKFVHEYGLFDVYVSAKDVDELRKWLIPYDSSLSDMQDMWVNWNRFRVEKFYQDRGETKQILF